MTKIQGKVYMRNRYSWVRRKLIEIKDIYEDGIGTNKTKFPDKNGRFPTIPAMMNAIKFMETTTQGERRARLEKEYDLTWGRVKKIKEAFQVLQVPGADKWGERKVIEEYWDKRIRGHINAVIDVMDKATNTGL
jgi:hypothetical protein